MRHLLYSTVAASVLVFSTGAQAVTFSSPASLTLIDFGTASSAGFQATTVPGTIDGETFSFVTSGSPATGVYAGSTDGVAFTPFGGSSLKDYAVAEPNGSIVITFSVARTAFALLWGSVDTYNRLTFSNGGATANTVITGADVDAAIGLPVSSSGTENVLISGLPSFTQVVVQTGTPAFEFVPAVPVPEPMSLALFGTGVIGVGVARYRRLRDEAV